MKPYIVATCGYTDLRKRRDGRFECRECHRVMADGWYMTMRAALSKVELRRLDSRPMLETNK